jgi:hypothetical protein
MLIIIFVTSYSQLYIIIMDLVTVCLAPPSFCSVFLDALIICYL